LSRAGRKNDTPKAAPALNASFLFRFTIWWPNVELIRVNDGATRAPHETCLRKASDTTIR
jgi:hypothetical protein